MKKFFTLLFLFALGILYAKVYAQDCTPMCPSVPVQNKFTPSKNLGTKWIGEKIAESIIKHEIKKEVKGKFKVDINSRSLTDLISGRFNYLSINGKNLKMEGARISKFSTSTICEYNSVKFNKDSIKFKENMLLSFDMEINNDDLNQTLIDTEYIQNLKRFTLINDIRTEIRNNKLYFIIEVPTFVTKPAKITVSSELKVKNGKIQLSNLQSTKNSIINTSKIIRIIEKTNPLDFTSEIMDNKNSKVSVDSVKIINDTIKIMGLVFIPKNTES